MQDFPNDYVDAASKLVIAVDQLYPGNPRSAQDIKCRHVVNGALPESSAALAILAGKVSKVEYYLGLRCTRASCSVTQETASSSW